MTGPRPNIEAIVQAIETQLDTIKSFYDKTTGEVVIVSEEFGEGAPDVEQAGARFVLIPPLTSNERFQIMEDFIESLPNESLQDELNMALIEKGAFQRFEEVLRRYPTRQEQWRHFKSAKVTQQAKRWLKANGIDS